MIISNPIELGMLIIAATGGIYAIVRGIIREQRVSQLEKENDYLKKRVDTLTDAIMKMK